MDTGRGFIAWVAGFTGVLLVTAAYRDKSPMQLIRDRLAGGSSTPTGPIGRAAGGSSSSKPAVKLPNPNEVSAFMFDSDGNPVTYAPTSSGTRTGPVRYA